ncbi:hypothetical protein APR50_35880 [Variovorax paradoxus]|jgi:hypothetical protein|uniref:hypothetical protein n=1 Tax=Variovorax TaxID=34072 RepID=UPI0006E5406E|nr:MULTISPECIES: hypothetical protein [unclassified Variovorax]KPU90750.1 hypothetical protein APR49_41350 [Variovorax paradoxus]KPU96354.1 hypothetical protein APR50_35880 [Variovorax paradoxus]KPV23676.1 hypothetical protein APR48_35440 [Variovorax paradoxus]KPV37222.1 hypothetical protein APR47_09095 [Variovorax paradoxus]MCT8173246.1 hypothetical protein [Variovorax sp. CY25R-8]
MISVILGSNDKPRMERFLALLGFASQDGRSYVAPGHQGFEFYFTEAPSKPSASTEIFVSVSSQADPDAFFETLEQIGLPFETWEHPRFYDVRVTDPAGRLWQVMLKS